MHVNDGRPANGNEANGLEEGNKHVEFSDGVGAPPRPATPGHETEPRRQLAHLSSQEALTTAKELDSKSLAGASSRLSSSITREELLADFRAREVASAALKRDMAADWLPEYRPASILPFIRTVDTVLERSTRISPAIILQDVPVGRKTKIVCTLGPSCFSEPGLLGLLGAGMDVARFNFSHGSHDSHQAVLDRLRQVAASKQRLIAYMLDTKGPEIRTAMLRGGKDINLVAGQEVVIVAVGDNYEKWEGCKDEATGETRIGLSYAKLCQSVKPGNIILVADGAINIEVLEIISASELKGRVINSHALGQRKNCNLPGVHVDLPVLSAKDIDDVQNFACKNGMDYIAASFVQHADDVRFIRRVLNEAGGGQLKIISKIENEAGLRNIDEILKESDGIMVARGDLAMEVPAEKIALAQKMIIAKCCLAGKFVITATQMLESMTSSPLPTRAEMTDVANAVFDGTDAVMLSGETANGQYPTIAVSTMAAIVETAELAVDHESQYDWIRTFTSSKSALTPLEAMFACVAKAANAFMVDRNRDGVLDASEGCIAVVLTRTGEAADLVAKYRPPCPVVVLSLDEGVLRKTSARYGLHPCLVQQVAETEVLVKHAMKYARSQKLLFDGRHVLVLSGTCEPWADQCPDLTVVTTGAPLSRMLSLQREDTMAGPISYMSPFQGNSIMCNQTLRIGVDVIVERLFNNRSTKIIATIGPACSAPDQLAHLVEGGVSIYCFDMKTTTQEQITQVIESLGHVLLDKSKEGQPKLYTSHPAIMISIQGPDFSTSSHRGGQDIVLEPSQEVILQAIDDVSWQSYKDADGGQTRIGIAYSGLCRLVAPGDNVLLACGTITVQVMEVLSATELKGKVTMSVARRLSERSSVDFPGKLLDMPYLSDKDVADLTFCAQSSMVDFVSLPYVQSADDVLQARKVLDQAGAPGLKLISQIDNAAAVQNYDAILEVSDGIIVSRGALGARLAPQKVAMAQKWMITKANLSGKPIVVSAQMLESMVTTPRPTRAEITDMANATYDGADAIMLQNETAVGQFVEKAVWHAAAILRNAEVGVDHYAQFNFTRNFTPKPMASLEAVASSAVKAAIDMSAALLCIVTNSITPIQVISKYRPWQAIVVATTRRRVAAQCNLLFGTVPLLLKSTHLNMEQVRDLVVEFARRQQLAEFILGDAKSDQLIVVSGTAGALFLTDDMLGDAEFVTLVVEDGEEASDVTSHTGYCGSETVAYRSTKVGLDLICDPIHSPRKTKIVCTLGPKCWGAEGLSALMDAGMNVARFNFSHGSHADHQEVLDRLRQVAADKQIKIATMLDTKGPEIRTAMLRNHQPIELKEGQDIIIVAVGEQYTQWEGYHDPATGETKIGLSYMHLCKDVKVGNRILIADGQISIQATEVIDKTQIRGKVLNSHTIGERQNCNLPGVKVQLPVLGEKDILDVQKFACKNQMDFVAASFVQTADDVRFIRKTLDQAGGRCIKIVCKIESAMGLQHYDAILQEADGIMVARGDLAMEIPSEKVALAQKMMITKANIAGKFVITATQMLESMMSSPLPTRAEMTDVANAVFDGTDAVMLSGETAKGEFPQKSVATMAAIVSNAEVGVNYYQTYDFIRDFTDRPMTTVEAVLSCASKDSLDINAGLIIVFTSKGDAARVVAKYRPQVPVLVVTNNERAVRQCGPVFALHPYLVPSLPHHREDLRFLFLLEKAAIYACEQGLCPLGKEIVVVHGCVRADAEGMPMVAIKTAPGQLEPYVSQHDVAKTLSLRATAISLADVLEYKCAARKTKIVCTLGPSCFSEAGLSGLLGAGMDVARFNFSHGTHDSHQAVLDRLRQVMGSCKGGRHIAVMLDTKGPEIRTAMVRGGKNIELAAGQEVVLVAVGADYETWEGYKDEATGKTKVGISYAKLCQSVKPGNRILISDGSLTIEVLEILSGTELRGRCLNHKSLGPRKNVNLPGVHVDLPVLTDKDVQDLQLFCCKNHMDMVAASFVQSADDVRFIRRVLDESGGHSIKIVSKIENEAGLVHYDDILKESDGIMVARGDLAMEIPSEKVALAQKMMITKANIAGKFVITATQMLESMTSSPLPTRAEMTDVANAVFDGTDAVMLSGETANGSFPLEAVKTMAAIVANAENANGYVAAQCFIRDHSTKPVTRGEAFGSLVASAMVDCNAQLVIIISEDGFAARLVAKYRPAVPQIVVTTSESVANQMSVLFGAYAVKVDALDDVDAAISVATSFAQQQLLLGSNEAPAVAVVLHGQTEPSADMSPVIRVVELRNSADGESALKQPSLQRAFSLVV